MCLVDIQNNVGVKTQEEFASQYGKEQVMFRQCDVTSIQSLEGESAILLIFFIEYYILQKNTLVTKYQYYLEGRDTLWDGGMVGTVTHFELIYKHLQIVNCFL